MIKINKIKIEINTNNGLFGSFFEFESGLNIVRGNNTSGKSSLFQAIIYCLGFEELLGGRNEKTMQSVLKDQVEFPDQDFHTVVQSFIILEIENNSKDVITIRRSVTSSSDRKPQLVDVYLGSILENPEKNFDYKPMYIHDKGGASNNTYGFHLFLENFIGISLPTVLLNSGDQKKLYLQQVASSYIIEQKTGWSDFFATMPYFNLQSKESRVIEFLLDLDVYENKKNKQKLLIEKRIIENDWRNFFINLKRFAEKGGGKLVGLNTKPEIINNYDSINISLNRNDNDYTISGFINLLLDELDELKKQEVGFVSDNVESNEQDLISLSDTLNQESFKIDLILSELSFDKERLEDYKKQLLFKQDELRKNKGAFKVKKLGAEFELKTSVNICPTCLHEIENSLLPPEIDEIPMRIDENIKFIESHIKMITVYINGLKESINKKETTISKSRNIQSDIRQQIRQIKQELVSNNKSPSIVEIEKRLKLEKKIEFYSKYLDDFNLLIEELQKISSKWERVASALKDFPKDFMSSNDRKKLYKLERNFRDFLSKFNYTSKSLDLISISRDTYLPVAKKPFENNLFYNIRFDSSASDFIRSIWAFTCSLYKTSKEFNGNHPSLLMLDEPKQQDVALGDFVSLLKELSSHNEGQVLLFASFENSDDTFNFCTKQLDFKLNYIDKKLIKPL
jgi:hypothetical protein